MVFIMSMATVMGPTPPGTGVMASAFSLIGSKSQSPTSRNPLGQVGADAMGAFQIKVVTGSDSFLMNTQNEAIPSAASGATLQIGGVKPRLDQ